MKKKVKLDNPIHAFPGDIIGTECMCMCVYVCMCAWCVCMCVWMGRFHMDCVKTSRWLFTDVITGSRFNCARTGTLGAHCVEHY